MSPPATSQAGEGLRHAAVFGVVGIAVAGTRRRAPRHLTAGCLAAATAVAISAGGPLGLAPAHKHALRAACLVVGFPLVAEALRAAFNLVCRGSSRAEFFPKGRVQLVDGRPVGEYGDIGGELYDLATGERVPPEALTDKGIGPDGHYVRNTTAYRGGLQDDDSSGSRVAAGELVLIANHGCPWAHRTLVTRALLGLEAAVPLLGTRTAFGGRFVLPAVSTMGWQLHEALPDAVCECNEALAALRSRQVKNWAICPHVRRPFVAH